MESSTVLAFRIFVMLSCLIIVPMAAIFGSAFPDVVKSVLVDRIVALSTGKPVEPPAEPADPNGFRQVVAGPDGEASSEAPASWDAAPRWEGQNERPAAWQGNESPAVVPVGGAAPQVGFNQSASFIAPLGSAPQSASQPISSSPYGPPGPIPGAAAAPLSAANEGQAMEMPGVAPVDRTACPLEQPDRFTEIERKLREYGASYYVLETWGNAGELYRFHCRMAVANGGSYSRHFEATNPNALQAMADVLGQVEGWRGGARQ